MKKKYTAYIYEFAYSANSMTAGPCDTRDAAAMLAMEIIKNAKNGINFTVEIREDEDD